MEITDTAPPSTIVIKLDFIAPFEALKALTEK